MTVADAAVMLATTSLLTSAASVGVHDYVRMAQDVRAQSDVRTLAVSLVRLCNDVGGARYRRPGWMGFDLLIGPGVRATAVGRDADRWLVPLGDPRVAALQDHLVTNAAGYPTRGPHDDVGWRGAYLDGPIRADPWGHGYVVNAAAAWSETADVKILSAGPDGIIESPFSADGLAPAGDDVVAGVFTHGCALRRRNVYDQR